MYSFIQKHIPISLRSFIIISLVVACQILWVTHVCFIAIVGWSLTKYIWLYMICYLIIYPGDLFSMLLQRYISFNLLVYIETHLNSGAEFRISGSSKSADFCDPDTNSNFIEQHVSNKIYMLINNMPGYYNHVRLWDMSLLSYISHKCIFANSRAFGSAGSAPRASTMPLRSQQQKHGGQMIVPILKPHSQELNNSNTS